MSAETMSMWNRSSSQAKSRLSLAFFHFYHDNS
jgi:hypothetical protein